MRERQTDRERKERKKERNKENEGKRYMTIMTGETVRVLRLLPQHENRGGVEVVYLTFLAHVFDRYEWVDTCICHFPFGKGNFSTKWLSCSLLELRDCLNVMEKHSISAENRISVSQTLFVCFTN